MFPFDLLNLSWGFKRYFDIAPALTDELQHAAYGIRHRVYCEELGFEAVRPDRLERDDYDGRSLHVVVKSLQVGRYVACARLVRADAADDSVLLPLEKTCAQSLDRTIIDPARLPRDTIGEISRMAVVPEFRRRKGEQKLAITVSEADFGTVEVPRFPYIQVGLYLGIVALAKQQGVETLFVLTEPRFAAHFAKLGMGIRQIGEGVEHRGVRVPSMMTVDYIEAHLPRSVRPLYELIGHAISTGVAAGEAAERAAARDLLAGSVAASAPRPLR